MSSPTDTDGAERRFARLRAASRALSTSLDYRVALDSVATTFVPALADWCTVKIFEPDGRPRLFVAHRDSSRLERLKEAALGATGRLGEPVKELLATGAALEVPSVRDALAPGAADGALDQELDGTALLLGLVARGRMFGALTLGRLETSPWEAADIELVEEVARRAALQVDNARLYQEAVDAAQAREDFLAMASHELRTPLTALQLELQLARRVLPEAEELAPMRARIDTALRQTRRLSGLIHELLDVSRIAAGQLELQRRDVDLVELARGVLERFEAETAASGVALRLVAPARLRGKWDASRLDQVVTNLVGNALKYGEGKPVELELVGDDTTARIVVRDEGIGIEASAHARIFERFSRAAPTGHSGLGLGLWIAQRIVHAHGGTIEVASAPLKGSTFTVVLPRGG